MEKKIITMSEIVKQSVSRADRWHGGDFRNWSLADWSNAFAGEAGEVCNAVKKYRRIEDGMASINEGARHVSSLLDARLKIAKELADTFLYMVLIAEYLELDLPQAIVDVFNQKSEEYGFPERLVPESALLESDLQRPITTELSNAIMHGNKSVGDAISFEPLPTNLGTSLDDIPAVVNSFSKVGSDE